MGRNPTPIPRVQPSTHLKRAEGRRGHPIALWDELVRRFGPLHEEVNHVLIGPWLLGSGVALCMRPDVKLSLEVVERFIEILEDVLCLEGALHVDLVEARVFHLLLVLLHNLRVIVVEVEHAAESCHGHHYDRVLFISGPTVELLQRLPTLMALMRPLTLLLSQTLVCIPRNMSI